MWLLSIIVTFAIIKILLVLFKPVPYLTISEVQHPTSTAYLDKLDKNIGITTPNCPYCGIELKKFPGRKTKCKNCNNYMYVRTRPADNKKIIITESQIELIEEDWAKVNGTYEIILEQKQKFQRYKLELIQIRKTENIKDNDVYWYMYQHDTAEQLINKKWCDLECTIEKQADLLYLEGKYEGALEYYLKSLYIHICMPYTEENSKGIEKHKFSSKEFIYSFNRNIPISNVLECMEKANLSNNDVKKIFKNISTVGIPLPISKKEAWEIISE